MKSYDDNCCQGQQLGAYLRITELQRNLTLSYLTLGEVISLEEAFDWLKWAAIKVMDATSLLTALNNTPGCL